jgi:nucleoside-diphosphate-sugar epimerase
MRVLIAGATGAIGRPLIRYLNRDHHTVYALARSPKSSRAVTELGAEPVIADALDAASVKAAITQVRPDAVINELTSLPSHYTAAEMRAAAERDRKVRIEGNVNLLAALRGARVRRYVLQSGGFWYAPGDGLADESVPFAFDASPAVAAGSRRYAELEATATGTPGIEFIALRCGFFYGPGTWFCRDGDMGEQAREQGVPVIGDGQGVWSWVHIEDAAAATAAALECRPGVYNVVDADPTPQRVWLPAFARAVGAPTPPQITEEEALVVFGPDAVYYAMQLRGASNEKAKRELNFRPRPLEWLHQSRPGLDPSADPRRSLARALLQ